MSGVNIPKQLHFTNFSHVGRDNFQLLILTSLSILYHIFTTSSAHFVVVVLLSLYFLMRFKTWLPIHLLQMQKFLNNSPQNAICQAEHIISFRQPHHWNRYTLLKSGIGYPNLISCVVLPYTPLFINFISLPFLF